MVLNRKVFPILFQSLWVGVLRNGRILSGFFLLLAVTLILVNLKLAWAPPQPVTLITRVDAGSGSVTPNCPGPGGCPIGMGSSETVTATPSSGWQFSSWSTQTGLPPNSCSTNPCTFTMAGPITLGATFTVASVGGQVFPINVAAVLAPWITLIIVITVGLVAAALFARRLVTKHN
jgi:hypothetical protein